MIRKKNFHRIIAGVISAMLFSSVSGVSALAASKKNNLINIQHSYTNNGYTFEKISHASEGTETADGVVDYLGNHNIEAYKDGVSETGKGDSTQSYSYCAATYGDWIYVGTMYGALSAYSQAKNALVGEGVSEDIATAVVDAMFNGKLNKGREEDGYYAGSVFFKFNVVTGETKVLMSREMFEKGECEGVPIFRSAVEYNNKLYFVGLVSKGDALTQYGSKALDMEIMMQTGVPSIYELDPTTDELVKVYECVDLEGYRALNAKNVFTSTRAIGTYKDYLIAGGLTIDTNNPDDNGQAVIYATNDPGSGDFKVIADMNDLFNYPAIWRDGSSGGGGIYQVVEYNNSLYVSIVSGTYDTMNEKTRQFRPFAVVRGDYDETKGTIDDANAWTWTPIIGDKENDNAKYTFGIDPERTSSGACTLQVYNDHLYIGEYNDVNGGLRGILQYKEFATLANNLTQSINLYRLDKDENVELVVGDPTEMFPEGGISGWGSGYETHMTQYTWMTTVYDDVMYLSTMDETSLLHVFAQLVNGELLEMSEEEWKSQVNYIKVLVELIKNSFKQDEKISLMSAENGIEELTEDNAIAIVEDAIENVDDVYSITDEQEKEVVDAIVDGDIDFNKDVINNKDANALDEINKTLDQLTALVSSNDIESFAKTYERLLNEYEKYKDELPDILKAAYKMLLDYVTLENMKDLLTCMKYMKDSVAGFDLYAIKEASDGSVDITTVTNNGFSDRYNHGLRIFATTTDYMVIGTANPFYGTQLWRMSATPDATYEHTHVAGEAVKENVVEATETTDGHYDSVVYCTGCGEEMSRTEVTIPATPKDPETPEKPDKPDKPETPNKPDKPDKPETPNKPDKPDKPETPKVPNNSGQSGNSGNTGNNNKTYGNKTLGSVSNKPKTGDTNSTLLWVIMGTMALGVMVVSGTILVVKKRKNNKLS